MLTVSCDCGEVRLQLSGSPRVRAYCHCDSCRVLHGEPLVAVTAWDRQAFLVVKGEGELSHFKLPGREMRRFWCRRCGMTVYNTNRFDLRLVATEALRKAAGGALPAGLEPDKHLFYASRRLDVEDPLPKFLEGVDGTRHGDS